MAYQNVTPGGWVGALKMFALDGNKWSIYLKILKMTHINGIETAYEQNIDIDKR